MNTQNTTFADLTDEEFDRCSAMDAQEYADYLKRRSAHIANGGEFNGARNERTYDAKARSQTTCTECRGSGKFTAYTGRIVGNCFKCDGTGVLTFGQAAHAKGVATKKAKIEAWATEHAAEIEYLRKRQDNWSFAASMLESINTYGRLTDNQLNAVNRAMANDAARDADLKAARDANSGDVDLTAIDKLFATAKSSGLKKPVWRAMGIEIHASRQYGDNTLWIKDTEQSRYVGKIVSGRFIAFNAASAETLPTLRAVAENPTQAAINYGQATNSCCCCGRPLVYGVSVVAGIGPICAERWGLDFLRDAAAIAVAAERALHEQPKQVKQATTPATTARKGTKKDAVQAMLIEGTTIAAIADALAVTNAAASALIGDVRRMGITVLRDGATYRIAG